VDHDRGVITQVVRTALQDPSLDVRDWSIEPLTGGFGEVTATTEGVCRVRGTAVAAGRPVRWSVVRKRLEGAPGDLDLVDWGYWKREALAYEADLLRDLPEGFAAPTCVAVHVIDDRHIEIWLEDVHEASSDSWPPARYGLAARHLGRFNGSYLAGRRLPTYPWLSAGRIRSWLALGRSGVADLARLAATPIGSAWMSVDDVARIRRQWRDRDQLLAGLDRLPRCLCHHDAFRRNLIGVRTPGGQDRTVAIDWAGVGIGAIGEDLAGLVGISLQFLDASMAQAADLDRVAFEGYVAGLRDVGATIDASRVRFGYAAAASLLLGVGGAAGWLAWLVEDPAHVENAERSIGHPLDVILDQWRGLQPFLLDLGVEARVLLRQAGTSA
jgi:Phosphotransferase enzyme family